MRATGRGHLLPHGKPSSAHGSPSPRQARAGQGGLPSQLSSGLAQPRTAQDRGVCCSSALMLPGLFPEGLCVEVGQGGFKRFFITPQVPKPATVRARAAPAGPGPALTAPHPSHYPALPDTCPEVGKTRHPVQAPGFLGPCGMNAVFLVCQQTPRPGGNR